MRLELKNKRFFSKNTNLFFIIGTNCSVWQFVGSVGQLAVLTWPSDVFDYADTRPGSKF